jgi:hypothetical protein
LKKESGYAGKGIAIESLIESNVSVTTRQSESEPIASVAATASVNRDDATGAAWRLKPIAPVGGVMALYPSTRARITRVVKRSLYSPAIFGQSSLEHGEKGACWMRTARLGGDA